MSFSISAAAVINNPLYSNKLVAFINGPGQAGQLLLRDSLTNTSARADKQLELFSHLEANLGANHMRSQCEIICSLD